ncbi:diguanylate cyclase domain-containing protein [Acetivibrio saccincola]|uniref:diguanylate cyclase domain-containing protein n=1 Tax=Acetivibrio saccincola TaxID=1677857 RepID=UPI001F46B5E2
MKDKKLTYADMAGMNLQIIMRGDSLESLEKEAKRIQEEFEEKKVLYYHGILYDKLTLSIGFSEYPNKAKGKSELIYQTDVALYNAKNLGKDKVHLYKDAIFTNSQAY